jgi:hypothetical protein
MTIQTLALKKHYFSLRANDPLAEASIASSA